MAWSVFPLRSGATAPSPVSPKVALSQAKLVGAGGAGNANFLAGASIAAGSMLFDTYVETLRFLCSTFGYNLRISCPLSVKT